MQKTATFSNEDTIWYEIEMLRYCYSFYASTGSGSEDQRNRYVHLECFLLHYRNLVACFSGKHHRQGDIDFSNVAEWSSRPVPSSDEVSAVMQSAATLDDEYYRDLSQFLAHVTSRRRDAKKWSVKIMNERMEGVIKLFSQSFPSTLRLCPDERASEVSLDSASTATFQVYPSPWSNG